MAFTATMTTDPAGTAIVEAFDNTIAILGSHAGSTRPSYAIAGTVWLSTSGSEDVLYVYADLEGSGNADYEIGTRLHGALKMLGATRSDRELRQAAIESRGSHPSASATTQGHVYEYTGDGRAWRVVDLGGGSYSKRAMIEAGTADLYAIDLPAGAWLADLTNAPVLAEEGLASGWKFTATNQKLKARVRVPLAWDGATAVTLRISSVLCQAETSGDDEYWQVRSLSLARNNNEVASGSPVTDSVAHDLGSSVSDGALNTHDITIAAADLTVGDDVLLEISVPTHGGAGTVGDRLFLGAELLFPVGNRLTE